MTPETVDVTGNLHFYSKKLENLNPGLYRIKVETLNSDGEVVSYTNARTVMMPKSLIPHQEKLYSRHKIRVRYSGFKICSKYI